jgi:hypothetical protein
MACVTFRGAARTGLTARLCSEPRQRLGVSLCEHSFAGGGGQTAALDGVHFPFCIRHHDRRRNGGARQNAERLFSLADADYSIIGGEEAS